jgi:predicted ATPase
VHEPFGEPARLKRYVLTGAPGAGKTVIIRQLEVEGFSVVEEAATDMIALKQAQGLDEPWSSHSFIDEIAHLQRARLLQSSYCPGEVQSHDRSIFCTAALSDYLGRPRPLVLSQELERVVAKCCFQPEVFFIRSLGFVTPTAARRISLEEAVRFERVHEEV